MASLKHDYLALALDALPYLVEVAKQGEQSGEHTITYKELGGHIGIHHRAVRHVLGRLRDEVLRPRGLPLLNTLVVNGKTRRPGPEAIPGGSQSEVRREQERVWRHPHDDWDKLLKEMGK